MEIKQSDYFNFGYKILGPFLYGFTRWLNDNLAKESIDKIFFFSRDGFMMQKAYQLFHVNNSKINHEYVYFSRNGLRRALLWTCNSYEDSLQYLSNQHLIAFSELASYYGLTHEDVNDFIDQIGINWSDFIDYKGLTQNYNIKKLYEQFKTLIHKRSQIQYDNLITYLNQIGMIGSCAIVDIGWHGSMQYYLEKILNTAQIKVRIVGFYIGINKTMPLQGNYYGYMFHNDNLHYRKKLLCSFGVYEKFFQSLEGSLDSYKKIKGEIIPILKEYEYAQDEQICKYIRNIQNGALEYVARNINEKLPCEEKSLFMPLVKFGMYPSLNQTKLFKFFYTTDGERLYFLPQKPLFSYKLKEFIQDLRNSMWKTGFMKEAFKIPFPYFWIYQLMKK